MAKKVGETDAHLIYGPYLHEKTRRISWWVIPAHGKKRVFGSKVKMLEFIDEITTNLKKK